MSDRFEEYWCRYCGFKTTTSAQLNSHISQSPTCLDRIIADNQPTSDLHKRHHLPTPEASSYHNDQPQPDNELLYSSLLKGQPPTKRAQVEVDDTPFKMNTVFNEFDPPAGEPRVTPINISSDFEQLQETQQISENQPWAPFPSIQDWDYAYWIMMESDLSQKQINAMLALDLVSEICIVVNTTVADKKSDKELLSILL